MERVMGRLKAALAMATFWKAHQLPTFSFRPGCWQARGMQLQSDCVSCCRLDLQLPSVSMLVCQEMRRW